MLSLTERRILSPFEMARSVLPALVGSQIKFSFLLLLLRPNLAAAQTEGWESLQHHSLHTKSEEDIYNKWLRKLRLSVMAFIRFSVLKAKTSQELRMPSRSLSDCKSLLLNVMIQVSQFIRNGQLCH